MSRPLTKRRLVRLLEKFLDQDPGFERGNYGRSSTYHDDVHRQETDRRTARLLLEMVSRDGRIHTPDLLDAIQSSYSGRLAVVRRRRGWQLEYTAGQYFPTEFCAAVCVSLTQCLYMLERKLDPDYTREEHYRWTQRLFCGSLQLRWFAF